MIQAGYVWINITQIVTQWHSVSSHRLMWLFGEGKTKQNITHSVFPAVALETEDLFFKHVEYLLPHSNWRQKQCFLNLLKSPNNGNVRHIHFHLCLPRSKREKLKPIWDLIPDCAKDWDLKSWWHCILDFWLKIMHRRK